VFTQGAEHDVVIVADEPGEFGDLVPYRTWEPRLVAGTQGLVPAAWHATQEQWGAVQFQNRFQRLAGRPMRALDYAMWVAVRAVGEAATRTRSTDLAAIRSYLRGPAFELAAFKGVPLTFRDWDWQLRQPIPLAHAASFVSMSPQAGFLHERTPLDTLGTDKAESACSLAARSPG
jgi:ABC transporter substrate binding protein (PQQ-dependent alcohol dehydrogenase system)